MREEIRCFLETDNAEDLSYNKTFFSQLAILEEGNFWFQARNRLICWCLERFFSNSCRFLEIGCGTGFVLKAIKEKFKDFHLAGAELFFEGLRFAKTRLPETEFIQLDVLDMPFVGHFDGIGVFDVLEHIEDDEQAIKKISLALKPGARLILTVPQHMFLWGHMDRLAFHKRRYSRMDLLTKLTEANLRVNFVTSLVTLLLPLMWLSRLKRRESDDVTEELRIGAVANSCLSAIMRLEYFLITSARLRFPFGGSLLVVCQKCETANA